MKIRFSHKNGLYNIEKDICLTEAFAEIENESFDYMFQNGWLPHFDGWYQARSCRLNLAPISARRNKELAQIVIDKQPQVDFFLQISGSQHDSLVYFLNEKHFKFGMDSALLGVVNEYDDQVFYSTMIYDKNLTTNSCGTLSYYYLIEKYRHTHKYLYTSTYYEEFAYKSKLPGFEYWDGTEWKTI